MRKPELDLKDQFFWAVGRLQSKESQKKTKRPEECDDELITEY